MRHEPVRLMLWLMLATIVVGALSLGLGLALLRAGMRVAAARRTPSLCKQETLHHPPLPLLGPVIVQTGDVTPSSLFVRARHCANTR